MTKHKMKFTEKELDLLTEALFSWQLAAGGSREYQDLMPEEFRDKTELSNELINRFNKRLGRGSWPPAIQDITRTTDRLNEE